MTKNEVMVEIRRLLSEKFQSDHDCSAPSAAEAVFEQIPCVLAEMDGCSGFDFQAIVRLAAHNYVGRKREAGETL